MADRKDPKRAPENATLTISLPKTLKERIEAEAAYDRRKVSPWCVIQLEKILDAIEDQKPAAGLRAAEAHDPSYTPPVHGNPVKYPGKKRAKLRPLDPPAEDDRKAN